MDQCCQFTFDSAERFEDQSKIIKLSTNTADKIYIFKIRNSLFRRKNGSSGNYLKVKAKTKMKINTITKIVKPGIKTNRIKTGNWTNFVQLEKL